MTKTRMSLVLGAVAALTLGTAGSGALASGGAPHFDSQSWSFSGPLGKFDRAQLKRGYQIYKDICAACHGMKFLAYRNLVDAGGPQYTADEAKAFAAEATVMDGPDDEGEMFERPGKLSDTFPTPYPNDNAARAANAGALPPDLSVMAKARNGGSDYLYALMMGYKDEAPAGFELADGMSYNEYFIGHQIGMPPPLFDEAVEYADGTKPTLDNHARDVAAFMMWAAEPKLEERHRTGMMVMLFLIVFSGLMYLVKRKIWAGVDH